MAGTKGLLDKKDPAGAGGAIGANKRHGGGASVRLDKSPRDNPFQKKTPPKRGQAREVLHFGPRVYIAPES
jgi:hypothetical protein